MTTTEERPPALGVEDFTTLEKLQLGWRALTEAEKPVAEQRLEDSLAMIRAEAPDLDARVWSGDLAVETVSLVLRDMARRSFQAVTDLPAGADSLQWATGPFSQRVGFGEAARDGALYLSKANRRMLGLGRGRAWAVDLLDREVAP